LSTLNAGLPAAALSFALTLVPSLDASLRRTGARRSFCHRTVQPCIEVRYAAGNTYRSPCHLDHTKIIGLVGLSFVLASPSASSLRATTRDAVAGEKSFLISSAGALPPSGASVGTSTIRSPDRGRAPEAEAAPSF